MSEKISINSSFNEEEENQEYGGPESDVDMNEANNAMHYSAFIKPGFINIGEEQYPYGEQIQEQDENQEQYEYQEQDEYLLGALEEGYTLEQLCQDIGECQKYFFSKDKESVKQPPFQINNEGFFEVPFSQIPIEYFCFNCYIMSDDKKVLYELDTKSQYIVSAAYYGDDNNVYSTNDYEIINSLLQEHQAHFDDDVLIYDKNNISVDNKSNIFMNESESVDGNEDQDVKSNSNRNTENINEDSFNNLSFSDENKLNNKNSNNANKNQQNSNIIENNNKDANKAELQKVQNELNKIYPENKNNNITDNNSKKNELQLEEYEPKKQNGCNCCLDCLKWCKQLF